MTNSQTTYRMTMAIAVAWFSSFTIGMGQVPSVSGTFFHDLNSNGLSDVNEGINGVSLVLYEDDGDLAFNIASDVLSGTIATTSGGQYGFGNLDPSKNYFVYQAPQTVGGVEFLSSVSNLLDPLMNTILVDAFESQQRVEGNPILPVGMTNLSTGSVLGGQRDLRVDYESGPAEIVLHANPWGLNKVLQFDQSAGSKGSAVITWDGLDNDMSLTPSDGLNNMDLTAGGGSAFSFMAGIDAAGSGDSITFRIFSDGDVSVATVALPVTDGTASAHVLLPFDSFSGAASFSMVDAIQAELSSSNPSIDAQLGPIHIAGGATANFSAVAIPEPSAGLLGAFGCIALLGLRRQRYLSL